MNIKKTDNIIAELSKYSKETLIKAFVKNNIFNSDMLLNYVRREEVQSILKKQENIQVEINKLDITRDYKKYVELNNSYERLSKQVNKLLGL